MMDRLVIGFLAGSAIFGAVLLGELSEAVDPPAALAPPALTDPAPAPVAQRPRVDELIQTTLAQPLFSPTRRPPDGPMADRSAVPELPNIRLTGIVIEPERHLAIFAVPGGKPLARAEGETINEWRLESIRPDQVSLSGPSGLTTLEPKADPNLVRPKPVAQPAARQPQPGGPAARPAVPPPRVVTVPPNRPPVPPVGPVRRLNPTRQQ